MSYTYDNYKFETIRFMQVRSPQIPRQIHAQCRFFIFSLLF